MPRTASASSLRWPETLPLLDRGFVVAQQRSWPRNVGNYRHILQSPAPHLVASAARRSST
jgi:hypothetical protein